MTPADEETPVRHANDAVVDGLCDMDELLSASERGDQRLTVRPALARVLPSVSNAISQRHSAHLPTGALPCNTGGARHRAFD
jgi:hypothetical protein